MDLITKEFFAGGGIVNPKAFPGFQLWFDASDASTITQSAGSVSQWNDKSGNANNLTQGTPTAQPTIQVGALNGRNTLLFTAANSQIMNLANTISNGSFTEFFVDKIVGGANWVGNTGASGQPAQITRSTTTIFMASNDGNFVNSGATFTDTTNYHLISGTSDGTSTDSKAFFDRSAVTLSAGGTLTLVSINAFGHSGQSGFANAAIAEYLRYSGVLNDFARHQIENYLRAKWATP